MKILKLPLKLFLLSVSIFFIFSLFSISKVYATDTVKTLYPTGDALVDSGTETTNYGSLSVLEAFYSTSHGTFRNSFVKFDLSTIPSNATIVSASFKLYSNGTCDGTMTPNLISTGQVTSNWIESTVTWKTMPTFTRGNSQSGSCGDPSFDVKSIVNNWRGGQQNYGLVVYAPSPSTSFLRRYYSREYGGLTYQPQLVVTYSLPVSSSSSTTSTGTLTLPNPTTTTSTTTSSTTVTPPAGNPPVNPGDSVVTPTLPKDAYYTDDWSTNPMFSPMYEMFGSLFFPCLALLCCCLPLILLLIIIVLLLTRKNKDKEKTQTPIEAKKVESVVTESKN